MKAIILAAGRGSRLSPLTDSTPKALLPINNKPIIEHLIELLPSSVDEVIIVVKYLKEEFYRYFENKENITIVEQGDEKGTFAALLSAKEYIKDNEKFLVLMGDDLLSRKDLEDMIQYDRAWGVYTAIRPSNYWSTSITKGVVDGLVPQSDEEKEKGCLCTTNVYVLDLGVFILNPEKTYSGELGLPHTLVKNSQHYPIPPFYQSYWKQINTIDDYEKIKEDFDIMESE
jgi:NDP-sugar pyrophosphorylase family protein